MKRTSTIFLSALALVIFVLISVFLILYMPAGLIFKIILISIASFTFLIMFALRHKKNNLPDNFILGTMMLIVLLSVVWPRYLFFKIDPLPRVNPQTLSIMFGLLVSLLSVTYSVTLSQKIKELFKCNSWLYMFIFTWFSWRMLANFMGLHPIESTADYLMECLYLASFLIIGCIFSTHNNGALVLLRVLMIGSLFVVLAGVIEAFTQKNLFVKYIALGGSSDEALNVLANIASDKVRSGAYRAQSVFTHPILFAQYCAAIAPLALYSIFYEKKWWGKAIGMLILPFALVAILKSGSRSGLVGFSVSLGLMGLYVWIRMFLFGKFSRAVAIFGVPLVAISIIGGFFALQQLVVGNSRVEYGSSIARETMFYNAIEALRDSPIYGYGHNMATIKAGIVNTKGITLDSYYLNIALDGGYISLAIFFMLIIIYFYKATTEVFNNKSNHGIFVAACASGVLSLVVTFGIVSITDNLSLFWLMIVITFCLHQIKDTSQKEINAKVISS